RDRAIGFAAAAASARSRAPIGNDCGGMICLIAPTQHRKSGAVPELHGSHPASSHSPLVNTRKEQGPTAPRLLIVGFTYAVPAVLGGRCMMPSSAPFRYAGRAFKFRFTSQTAQRSQPAPLLVT